MQSAGSHPCLTLQEALQTLAECEAPARHAHTPCGDGTIAWRIWGTGDPLVLFHGSHGYWAHWIRNIPALSRHFTLYVPDLPGMGESADAGTSDHAEYVRPLAAGLRGLGCADAAIAGFSYGGVIAAHLAAGHPDLIRAVCIVGSGGLATPLGPLDLKSMRGLSESERHDANRHNLASLMLHDESSIDELAIAIHTSGARRHRVPTHAMVMPDHVLRAMPDIAVPFGAIWGELDNAHPDPAVQEAALRKVRPDVDFRVIEGAGHWCMYERPAPFNDALIRMLDRG